MDFDKIENCISIECVDNADGFHRVVIYDGKTFPISSQQEAIERTVSDDGQGLYSSVRPFQFAHSENEDTAIDGDPPASDSNSPASLQEEEEEDEDD